MRILHSATLAAFIGTTLIAAESTPPAVVEAQPVAAASPAPALTGNNHHFRLTLQSLPESLEVDTSSGGTATTRSIDIDEGGRVSVGYWWGGHRQISFLLGSGIDFTSFTFDDGTRENTIDQAGVFVEPGVSVRFAPWFSGELAGRLGVGVARASDSSDDTTYTDRGYGEISVRTRAVFTVARHVELFVELGYLEQAFSFSYQLPGVSVVQEVELSGGFGALGIGGAF